MIQLIAESSDHLNWPDAIALVASFAMIGFLTWVLAKYG